MAAQVKNTRDVITRESFRMKALVYALPGTGKTSWIGTCDPETTGICAVETGVGSGLLSIADRGFAYIEPENLSDVEAFCKGKIFPNADTLVLDSLSALSKTYVKDAALAIPRTGADSPKRKLGLPELDDYGSMAELTRKILNMLINCNPDKNIIVTATEKYDRAGANDAPGTESLITPDLAGQMALGSSAMFDFVLRLRTRAAFKNPLKPDPKEKYIQRYFQTQQENGVIAKCRSNSKGIALLDREEIFDLQTGEGSFTMLRDKILKGYGF